jgi:hypothetical protein
MTEYVRAPEQPTSVDIRMIDGLFVKSTVFPRAGMIVPQHAHAYAHASIVAAGAVEVEKNGELMGRFDAPAVIRIEARAKHLFKILSPGTCVMCVHNSDRCEAGEVAIHEEHHLTFVGDT